MEDMLNVARGDRASTASTDDQWPMNSGHEGQGGQEAMVSVGSSLGDIAPTLAATDPDAMNQFNGSLIAEFRGSGGKLGGQFTGAPVLLLNTVGAKSGVRRTTPINYSRDGDRYVVVAAKSGAPTNPDWYYNLLADPMVTVESGTETFVARSRVVDGAERDRLFDQHAALLPNFAEFQRRTSRRIPVVILERAR